MLIQARGNALHPEVYERVTSIGNKEKLPKQWKESDTVPIYKEVIKLSVIVIGELHCYQEHSEVYAIFVCQG
jgi:hypothetical protein